MRLNQYMNTLKNYNMSFGAETTMPSILALRWLDAELLEKALGTQESYLFS